MLLLSAQMGEHAYSWLGDRRTYCHTHSRVFVWGYNGYCRLGLGDQKDVLVPKMVPQFAGPNEITMGAYVSAGPSNSIVIDKQGMYWIAGKWKNTGDGTQSLSPTLDVNFSDSLT